MTRFRPCIDLREGKVVQIVGGTLSDDGAGLETNFVSERPASWFAKRYRDDGLRGGHVIMLGPGNEAPAKEALAAFPGGLQAGGGISARNARQWLDAGASHVIVTSALFDGEGRFLEGKLRELSGMVGRERLVVDLSCRVAGEGWVVAMNRWQTLTDLKVESATLDRLSCFCAEFLIHAVDVEGLCEGIDERLVAFLGQWGGAPVTYAGGARDFGDLARVDSLSSGLVDLTIGSALDLFGGKLVKYEDCVAWNRRD
jgi:phosphoribosylformimino-5-aminoimidazole carboxamide ribotide isomerase